MRKGITPIIAIIILLLITVALAGVAWKYLSSYMTGLTGQSVELRDYFCIKDCTATLIIANTGTLKIATSEISIIDVSTGDTIGDDGEWTDPSGKGTSEIPVNSYATWKNGTSSKFTCNPSCTLRVVGGTQRAQVAKIYCK